MKLPTLSLVTCCLFITSAVAADYYVSATRGKGKKASKGKPAKDLGNIIKKLKAGDTVHIAGGVYLGRGKCGSDVITVPVSIIGGYSDDFSKRDPWGAHRTVLSGDNHSKNYKGTPRLMIDLMKYRGKEMPKIVVDGVIVDGGANNRYKTDKNLVIVRRANPKTGQNPTPSQGGLIVRASKTGNFTAGVHWDITVQNCVVTNTAPTQGALSVSGYKGSKVKIQNNIIVNNTGTGLLVGSKYMGADKGPEFTISNNTILFTWKYEPSSQSFSGNSFKAGTGAIVKLKNNVLGFADRAGVHNAAKAEILMQHNLIVANVEMDYLEFDTKINLDDIEDEAEYLHEDSEENVAKPFKVAVDASWLKKYGARVLVDRNAQEADLKVQKTRANELRQMLGLPVQAGVLNTPEAAVWLHRISLEDAIKAGSQKVHKSYGSSKP